MENKYHITLVGSGMIGAGLAVNALMNGHPTIIYDVIDLEKVKKTVQDVLDIMVEAGAITGEKAAEAASLASYTNDLDGAVEKADFVQECVPERIELKQSIYRQIQEKRGDKVVICSSTSAIMPSVLQKDMLYPKKILVGHPYNPSYLLPLIEVCGGPDADQEVVELVMNIYRSMGKEPIYCKKETEGFIVNKLSWAAMDAAKKVVLDGVCSVEDIDKAIIYGPGMRMAVTGQIMTMSLGVQGGLKAAAAKYGKEPNEADVILGDGVDAEIAARPKEFGNTVEDVIKFRDKMFAVILKEYGKL